MAVTRQSSGQVVFFRSDLLHDAGGVAHGFSTRVGGVSRGQFASLNLGHTRGDDPAAVKENYRRFCQATGTDVARLVFTKQVHGDALRVVTEEDAGKGLYRPRGWEVDGLITNVPGLPLVVFSADCIPVLLYDPVSRCIGACHCGWRGTALGLAKKTAQALCTQYGARPENLLAAIGPGISRCCFETHRDVPEAMLAALGQEAQAAIQPAPPSLEGEDKYLVDCKSINRTWLLQAGLTEAHIEISDQCTCCDATHFWSHRKLGQKRGSMVAVLQLS